MAVATGDHVRGACALALLAGAIAAVLLYLGPPGTDFAEHAYQEGFYSQHGFVLWNNLWYSGRYSFVTSRVLYSPLAAFFGIEPLAIASIATAALAFTVVVGQQWGPLARWSSRSFAVVWAGLIVSAHDFQGRPAKLNNLIAEMDESMKIIHQAIDRVPDGPINIDDKRVMLPPKEKVHTSMEALIGALRHGGNGAWRRFASASPVHLQRSLESEPHQIQARLFHAPHQKRPGCPP